MQTWAQFGILGVLRKLLFITCLLVLPFAAQAGIYKWTDQYGKIHFSDKPVAGSKKQHLRSMTGISNPSFNLKRNVMHVPYQDINGSMVVQGQINNVRMRFIVDTGATLVVIPPNMAKKAGINTQNAKTITIQTANGATQSYMVNIANMQVEKLRQQSIPAAIQQVSPNANMGLLGMSFLSAYKMSIDHDQHIITLESR